MNTKCALEILENKNFIKIKRKWKNKKELPPEMRLYVIKGDKLFKKIDSIFLEDNNYKHQKSDCNKRIIDFVNIQELNNWLEQFKNKERSRCHFSFENYIDIWINNCTDFRTEKDKEYGDYIFDLIYEPLEKKRIEEEEKEEEYAIKLLEEII